ncbi:hypothetical protein [Methylocella sp.]|uniref:hypothetical protein n=1 Tax=Methylocella sp. TaxID=1978226 RepID=UPI003782D6DB
MDDVHYREYKILLRPERFFAPSQFEAFWKKVRAVAEKTGVDVETAKRAFDREVREIQFYDTDGADLYRNAFILRKRTFYVDGWPAAEHELTLKFRHPELPVAAATDVTPHLAVDADIKFKEEILPLKASVGGLRRLYSHNCVLATPQLEIEQGLAHIASVFPCLDALVKSSNGAPLRLVNDLPVEEIMVEPGRLDFGHRLDAKATIALWRNRSTETSLIGEFAFQAKFESYDGLSDKAKARSEAFFMELQRDAPEWVALGTTKTAVVYQFGGRPECGRE